jgi:hypothetical protein
MSHHVSAILLGFAAGVFLSGCCVPWKGPATVTSTTGETLCAKHQIPLVTARGYEHRDKKGEWSIMCFDPPNAYFCYPNPWPPGVFRKPNLCFEATHPTTVRYCVKCD